jgi:hypothetical protein
VSKAARRGAPVAVAALLALALSDVASAEEGSRYDDTVITITYTGTLKSVRNGPATQPLVTQVDWILVWTGTVYSLEHVPQYFTVRKLSGATAATVPANAALNCSATITQRVGVGVPVSGGRAPASKLLTVEANAPSNGAQLQNDDMSPGRLCDTYPGLYGGAPNLSPHVSLRLGSGTTSVARQFDATYDGPSGPGTETDTLSSTLKLNLGNASGGALPSGPSTPDAVRRTARRAIAWAAPTAAYSCFVADTGVVVLATTGPALGVVVGSTMTAVAAPVCARLIQALKRLALTYNDPPVGRFNRIARVPATAPPKLKLPSCARGAAQVRAACKRLTRAVRRYVAAVQGVTDVASTLATTVGRESAARRAGHTAAARRQARRALSLVPTLRAAARAQSRTGTAFAAALRAAGASGQMTPEQRAAGNDAVLRRFLAAGVLSPDITSVVAPALTPGPLDVLATLGRKLT